MLEPEESLLILVNQKYFREPRRVCLVDEINPILANGVELLVFPPIDKELK